MKIGFLIIDLQTIHVQDRVDKTEINKACQYINYVSKLLRTKEHVVVHIQDIEGMNDATKDKYNIIPEVHIADTDLKVSKKFSNAFWQTELEQLLKSHGVELLIISGFAAEYCVLFTYNGATERGFKPVLLQNGFLSINSDMIASTYRDRNVISYPAIEYLLK
ncbi:cysteine hydrolase family protein [Paenibacillus sp. L3-i20]|uniref:cysteine hydrolase family protein n=1 Tax=Paenibacillus sp. L3-i20 TaxID=2905833 RepID=UPI001EE04A20|nr:isochorismatase family protein [Paenibacillus sp. L3-i20]GKU77445.1 hypothetical protein L3i20_v218420 [Paenibacillus sp. L3-i20]